LKEKLVDTFKMTDLGILHFFLDIQVLKMDDGIFLSQPKYVLSLLQRLKMEVYKPCTALILTRVKMTKECDSSKVDATFYKKLVGSLIYIIQNQTNILFTYIMDSIFM